MDTTTEIKSNIQNQLEFKRKKIKHIDISKPNKSVAKIPNEDQHMEQDSDFQLGDKKATTKPSTPKESVITTQQKKESSVQATEKAEDILGNDNGQTEAAPETVKEDNAVEARHDKSKTEDDSDDKTNGSDNAEQNDISAPDSTDGIVNNKLNSILDIIKTGKLFLCPFDPFVTNGLTHRNHLGEFTFI